MDQRASLLNRIDEILHEAHCTGLMLQPLWCSDLDAAALLTLLTGGLHPSITDPELQHRLLAHIMAHLPEWITARKERLAAFAEIEESLEL
jgi:hypothetical protein